MEKSHKIFYGWWVVLVITILFFIGGAAPFAVVLKQLMMQFHTGRGEVSLSQSINSIAGGVMGIFVGRMLQHNSPKKFMLWGSIISGLSTLTISLAHSLWFLYLFFLIGGIAGAFSNAIAMFTILSRWFTKKWGTAIGIAMTGGGIGSILIQPLVGSIAQNYGWQATYILAGGLVLVINVPLILFVLKDRPEAMGLLADGEKPEIGQVIIKQNIQTPLKLSGDDGNTRFLSYIKNPSLWLMGLSFAFAAIGSSAVTTQEVSLLTDMHVSDTVAATARGITLGIGAVSALASGWLADKFISRYVTLLFFLLAMIGMFILMPAVSMSQIWPFVIIYGLGIGAGGTLLPVVTKDIFGARDFSAMFGFVIVLLAAGNSIGAPLAGFMYDATGSYHRVFMIITGIYAAAIIALYFAFGANPKPLLRSAKTIKKDRAEF
ncbi:MAG: MFS transporter [Dehalococcoidales bacterium]|jgi:sugar phosphate permease